VEVPLSGIVRVGFVDELLVMLSWPVIEPVAVGLNNTLAVPVCPGLRVMGRLTGDSEKALPVTVMEFTVTGEVPLEVNVKICATGVFSSTLPNEILVAFTVSMAVPAFSFREMVREVLPVVAVSVTDCAVVTEATVAVKAAPVAVAGTMTELGTVTELLLLARATLTPPPGAVPDNVTVQESDSVPEMEVLEQERPLTVGVAELPVPLRLTVAVVADVATFNCPVTELAVVGLN
jgi:hypothetical protein